ncbi:MAG: alpha/beta hydrolase-fold protein [Lachnospiraceae bacterium]|nr:alpha/beta hydrolase-fold protein [Lachnospiraceae bacterium]
MIIKDFIQIPALSGKEKRRLYIYLPPEYDNNTESYPVMYMFDGHNVFFDEDATYGKCWGMKDYLEQTNPKLIIVAVECNHEGNMRLSEYSPWNFEDKQLGKIKGLGKLYMDWLVTKLKPEVDASLRTKPGRDYTSICGSSMGGLMTVYAITAYNHIFSKGAALSPSLWCKPENMLQLIHDSAIAENTILYMDYGSAESGYKTRMKYILKQVGDAFLDKNVLLSLRIVPGGKHCEACWEQQIPVFMKCLDYPKD